VTVSNADAKELGMSNEIVANGGLNGSYATITTKDGIKLENCYRSTRSGSWYCWFCLRLWSYGSFKEEMQVGIRLRFI
jgi:molybdopterin-containing oxidoreductase family iron-sulfur binding subunit